uniref:Uncharacterized protein n=1 Tax=Arundo donax TaxID=35708 RepID=A0A0A9G146_ARUDO
MALSVARIDLPALPPTAASTVAASKSVRIHHSQTQTKARSIHRHHAAAQTLQDRGDKQCPVPSCSRSKVVRVWSL